MSRLGQIVSLAAARSRGPKGRAAASGLALAEALDSPSLTGAAGAAPWSLGQLAGRLVELCGDESDAQLTLAFALVREALARREPVAWIAVRGDAGFHPCDVAASGVDLDALTVVRAPKLEQAIGAAVRLARSGGFELLVLDVGELASQGTAARVPQGPLAQLLKLAGKHGVTVLFLTEEKRGERESPAPTEGTALGSLISLRARSSRRRAEASSGGSGEAKEPLVTDGEAQRDARSRRALPGVTDARRAEAAGRPSGDGDAPATDGEARSDSRWICELVAVKDKRRAPGWTHAEVCRGPTGLR